MEATDSERYKSLKDFITVPNIENAESNLRVVARTVAKELDEAIQQKYTAETTLQQFWEVEGRPQSDYLTWARSAVQHAVVDQQHRIDSDLAILWTLDRAAEARAKLQTVDEEWQQAKVTHTALQAQLVAASQQQPNADLVATLQAAQSYLHNHPDIGHCPVCAKPESAAVLRQQITTQQQLEQSARALQRGEVTWDNAQRAWQQAYAHLVEQLQASGRLRVNMAPDAADEAAAQQSLNRLLPHREKLAQRIEQAQRVVAQHNALATQLYTRIHPDEPLGNPSFGLKKRTIGSLTLTGVFGSNSEVPPAAYYSEAHLDTLGLCVYLALAKQSGNALVVLDDVLMSIDDPHLDRVIELINEESAHFGHVIITTHSRAWFDRMRHGGGMQADLIELYGWDLNNGMHHSRAPLAVDDLRHALRATRLDRQLVASRAGILLEQLLDNLTLHYRCRLPRQMLPRYTLGELAVGLDKRLCGLLRTEQVNLDGTIKTDALFGLLEAATKDTWIRNQVGAHFNPDAAAISDAMVRQFGENVLALADTLLCDHCRQLPRKNKSGSYWECGGGCGKIRLYPLAAP